MNIKKIFILLIIIIFGGMLMFNINERTQIDKLNKYILEGNILKVEEQINKVHNLNTTPYLFENDRVNYSPLVLAASQGNIDICKLLIENGADINYSKGTKNATPLIASLYSNNYEMATYLIENGADVTKIDFHRDTALALVFTKNVGTRENYDYELERKQYELASLIISKSGNIIEAGGRGNLLFYVANNNNLRMLKYLIEDNNIDINLKVDKYNYTPLMYAISMQNIEIITYLITKGADETIKNKYGESAYDLAIKTKNQEIIDLLSTS